MKILVLGPAQDGELAVEIKLPTQTTGTETIDDDQMPPLGTALAHQRSAMLA